MTAKYRRLADELVAAIRAGTYQPGDRLPSVRQLQAAGWGLSTVQAALQALADEGWTRPVSGSGTYVADPLPSGPARTDRERIEDLERRVAALEARDGTGGGG